MFKDIENVNIALKEIRTVLWLSGAIIHYNERPLSITQQIIENPKVEDQEFIKRANDLYRLMNAELTKNGAIIEMRIVLISKFNFHLKRIEPALINACNAIKHRCEALHSIEEKMYTQGIKFIAATDIAKTENDFFAKNALVNSIVKTISPYVQNTGDASPANIEDYLLSLQSSLNKQENFMVTTQVLTDFYRNYANLKKFKLNIENNRPIDHEVFKDFIQDLPLPIDLDQETTKLDEKLSGYFHAPNEIGKVGNIGQVYGEDVNQFITSLNHIVQSFDHLLTQSHVAYETIKLNVNAGFATIDDMIRTMIPAKITEISNVVKTTENVVTVDASDVELIKTNENIIEYLCRFLIETDRSIINMFNKLTQNFLAFNAVGSFLARVFENSGLNLTMDVKPSIPIPQPDIPLPELEQEIKENNDELEKLADGTDAEANKVEELTDRFEKEMDETKRKELQEKLMKEMEKKKKTEEAEKKKQEREAKKENKEQKPQGGNEGGDDMADLEAALGDI